MYKNYITRSDVAHEPVLKLYQVVCNTTYNAFHNNKGKVIMEVDGFDNVRLPIYQSFTHNGFYNNYAYGLHCDKTTFGRCRWGSRATVVAGSAGQVRLEILIQASFLRAHHFCSKKKMFTFS